MHTRGDFTPDTETAASERYAELHPVAETVVKEVATAMGFDREEFQSRITDAVVSRAQDVLFASSLTVTVGTRSEFDDWAAEHAGEVVLLGGENVEHVAWHEPPVGDVVATTFQNEEDAAVETLRRQSFGRVYRDLV